MFLWGTFGQTKVVGGVFCDAFSWDLFGGWLIAWTIWFFEKAKNSTGGFFKEIKDVR